MNFIKGIFKKGSDKPEQIDPNFPSWVKKAIVLTGTTGRGLDNEQLVALFVSNGIPESEAVEIMLFLPITFCRKLLPQIKWHNHYVDFYSETKQITRLYQDNPRYRVIQAETENYWDSNPGKEAVLSTAGRSADFNAINQLLLGGSRLEDITVTENFIVR